jgi:hypothetical protein
MLPCCRYKGDLKVNKNVDISKWTIKTIMDLPKEENDNIEFKSGLIKPEVLSKRLSIAASAFSNATGGLLIVGVSDEGNIDGIEEKIGNTHIRDWIDHVISVEPMVNYKIKIIKTSGAGILETGKCLVVIQFFHSSSAPHTACDKKYYFRNGAQSIPASHYLIEAIRLRANYNRPVLACRLTMSTVRYNTIQLEIFTINKTNAYNVKISFLNKSELFHALQNVFPLVIPIINDGHPLVIDVDNYDLRSPTWENGKICVDLEYEDENHNKYSQRFTLDEFKELPPRLIGNNILAKIVTAIEKIPPALKK